MNFLLQLFSVKCSVRFKAEASSRVGVTHVTLIGRSCVRKSMPLQRLKVQPPIHKFKWLCPTSQHNDRTRSEATEKKFQVTSKASGIQKKFIFRTMLLISPTVSSCVQKVKLSLYLTKHHAIKTYCGSGGIAPRIL
jgi:hypothetical protein